MTVVGRMQILRLTTVKISVNATKYVTAFYTAVQFNTTIVVENFLAPRTCTTASSYGPKVLILCQLPITCLYMPCY